MANFQKVKIKDHCEITSSKRIFADEYLTSGVPFYRGKEISQKQRSSDEVTDLIYISREKFEEIKAKFGAPQKGDLLLTSVGTIGNPYLVKANEEFYFKDGNLTWFRNFRGINGQWLYYWLLSPQGKSELNKCTIGSSQKAYTINLLYGLQIELPDAKTQTRIASILSAYDDLIENNEKRIKTLEEMTQLLYTEWFVKFKFPGHEKVKMVDSGTEYGKVPDGWEVKRLGDFINVRGGLSYKNEFLSRDSSQLPLITMGCIHSKSLFNFSGLGYYTGSFGKNHQLKGGDLVMATRDVTSERKILGSPAIVPNIFKEAIAATNVYIVDIMDSGFDKKYLYMLFRNSAFRKRMIGCATGTNVLMIVKEHVLGFKFLSPNKKVLSEFSNKIEPVFSELEKLEIINQNLSKTRDLLIPQLVTGKREVK